MSRLDSFIRRLIAQREALDWAARSIADRDGLVLELGLGNGRTYDHLRARLPGRRVIAFDRQLATHPLSRPPAEDLVLGELSETLPLFLARRGPGCADLIHADLGNGITEESSRNLLGLLPGIVALLSPGGLLVSDGPVPAASELTAVESPGTGVRRCFVYRRITQGSVNQER